MTNDKGFSLIEMIVTFMIIAVIATIAVPSYFTYIQQGEARAAQNNLVTLYTAEKNYYFSNSGYCTSTSTALASCNTLLSDSNCGDTLAALNCNLSLNITDSNFNYTCTSSSGFTCTATNTTAATFTLNVIGPASNQIVLPGGTGCTGGSLTPPTACNPYCTYAAHPNYCPTTGN